MESVRIKPFFWINVEKHYYFFLLRLTEFLISTIVLWILWSPECDYYISFTAVFESVVSLVMMGYDEGKGLSLIIVKIL